VASAASTSGPVSSGASGGGVLGTAGGGSGGGSYTPDLNQQFVDLAGAVAANTAADKGFQEEITAAINESAPKLSELTDAIATQTSTITQLTTQNAAQTKEIGLLQQLSSATSAKAEAQAAIARDTGRYKDKLISKTTYESNIKIWTGKLTAADTSITSLNSQIDELKKAA